MFALRPRLPIPALIALSVLGLYVLGWIAFAGYYIATGESLRGVAWGIGTTILIFAALGWLASRHPVGAGVLFILPCAFPIGFFSAALGVPDDASGLEVAFFFTWFVGVPALVGLLFLLSGLVMRLGHDPRGWLDMY